jgi:acyl dehydratase
MMDTRKFYLDDLHPGLRFTTAEHPVDALQIVDFASRWDPQPFHLDAEAAKATFFQGLAASGWHTAAITMRLLVTSGLPLGDGIIGAGGELSWPKPTRPGDRLRVESEVLDVIPSRSRPDRGMVQMKCETMNQHGDLLQRFLPKLVVFRAPAAPPVPPR